MSHIYNNSPEKVSMRYPRPTKEELFELCRLVDKIPMDIETERMPASESVRMFLELTRKASSVLGAGALAAKDGRFDAAERQELEPLLRELLQATGDLIASLRSR